MIEAMNCFRDIRLLSVAKRGRVEIRYRCGGILTATVAGSAHDRLAWAIASCRSHVLAGHDVRDGSGAGPSQRILSGVQVAFGPTMRPDSDHRLVSLEIDGDRTRPPGQIVTAWCHCDFLQQHAGTRDTHDALDSALFGIDAHVRAAELARAEAIARLDALPSMTYVLTDGERTIECRQKGTLVDGEIARLWRWFPSGVQVSEIDALGALVRTGGLDWDESFDGDITALGVLWASVPAGSAG